MKRRLLSVALAIAAGTLLCGTGEARDRYDYGGGGFASGEKGFLVFVEAGLANPRNTDNVVAAAGSNVIIPEWDDEFAGRLGFGYQFSGGNRVVASFWGFSAEQSEARFGGFDFPNGPTSGSSFDLTTEIEAASAEVSWIILHEVTESFAIDWSVGLRYASFDETTGGTYGGTPDGTVVVDKANQGAMVGARAGARVTYRRGHWSGSAGVGLSLLDGEIEASSSVTPQPAGTYPLGLTDDSRSGTLFDFDVRGAWHGSGDAVSVWLGWEQQEWEDIAADLARNLPESDVISRARDSVTFSWFKAGVSFKF